MNIINFSKKEEAFFIISIENWYENGPKIQGGNNVYSDKVVILVHIITSLFRIGLRQTVRYIKGYLEQIGRNLQVISYSQASKKT